MRERDARKPIISFGDNVKEETKPNLKVFVAGIGWGIGSEGQVANLFIVVQGK
jgi:hypothetical protein